MLKLKDTHIGYRFLNYKKCSCFYVFDDLTFTKFKLLNKQLNKIDFDCIEVSLNKKVSKETLEKKYGYIFVNKWYMGEVLKDVDTTFNKNIFLIKNREQIEHLIKQKQLECAEREPFKFDKNKQDEYWKGFGKEAIALKLDGRILSFLTFTEEKHKNLRVRLLYTVKSYQRHGLGTLLLEHAFKIAKIRHLNTVTICVDNSEGEHIENLILNYKFKHIKNGYVKLLK